ncbi:MAG: NAD-dependent epimerase/dehydratase family protein [Actinobacteria bacterium]|nr:NAD-dependent epimerase/dehydratase family protein [Actinomycetota bacterium]MBU1942481.1 NAD-dependent epimerase/dehydratase family protein [Actinomycetota bacterium]MBU2687050.1 NAD-dependent epimerase/dehydratase family protein [Actinomycetota bacterium]
MNDPDLRNVLVTGSSGYIGSKLVDLLDGKPDIGRIVGVDVKAPTREREKFKFLKRDIREPLTEALREFDINAIFHLAFVKIPIHDKSLMEDININGALNVMRSSLESNVRQIIYASSATAYGFHRDNDNPLTESSPLRGNDSYIYTKDKKLIEAHFETFSAEHPEIRVSIVRPVFVVGKGFDDPLSEHLLDKFCLIPTRACELQFVHEDDMMDILYLLYSKGISGAFNVGSSGTLSFPEMVRMVGSWPVAIPFQLLYGINSVAWTLRLTFISEEPSPGLLGLRYPWIVSSEKLKRETGFEYRYTSREAFQDWVDHVKSKA